MVHDPTQRMMHYRRFKSGIADMKVFTADDCIALLQQLPYVIGTEVRIISERFEVDGAEVLCGDELLKACITTREILSLLKKRELKESDLDLLDEGNRYTLSIPKVRLKLYIHYFLTRGGEAWWIFI